jgi:hypothetical protein
MSKADNKATLSPKLERMLADAAERGKARVIQLPLWAEPKRGAPNSFIRSALFAAIQGKDRRFLKEETLASLSGITVKFTGEQLTQSDMDVWEQIVHFHRQHPLGQTCEFTAHGLLKALGLNTGSSEHKQLHSTIIRLSACVVEVTHNSRTYFGSLIKSGVKDEITRHYRIELNRELIQLFGENQWTALDWQQRQMLKRQPLAQALHAFYSSHRQPFPMKLATLKDITGSRNSQSASFKRQVNKALTVLVGLGFLSAFEISGEDVSVTRAFPVLPRD